MLKKLLCVLSVLITSVVAGEIALEQPEHFSKGYRIIIKATIKEDTGVADARVYFKSKNSKLYHFFAPMKCKGEVCEGVIPVTQSSTKKIDYFVLYQNNSADIFKTKELNIAQKEFLALPEWQNADTTRLILRSELVKTPKEVYGFNDSVKIEKVDTDAKIGLLAGVYTKKMVGVKEVSEVEGTFAGDAKTSNLSLGSISTGTALKAVGGFLLLMLLL